MPDCVFCGIIAGRVPASLVAQSAHSLAFCDLRQPHAEDIGAHLLVVPRRHVETLAGLTDAVEAGDLLTLAARVAAALAAEFGPQGYSLWQSNGEAAFQEVPHVHLHLLTRRIGDGLLRIYPQRTPSATSRPRLDALAASIAGRLDDRSTR